MDSHSSRSGASMLGVVPSSMRLGSVSTLNWKQRAEQLQKQGHVLYFVFKHRRTRWYSKLIAICSAAYVLSPVQLIPNFIPVIGWLDDVLVLFLGQRYFKRLPRQTSLPTAAILPRLPAMIEKTTSNGR